MEEFTDEFVDKIALSCIELYNTIPKIGKPIAGEWTVLSCILQLDTIRKKCEIVSFGTGSKCIGATKMSPEGIKVNDSHAEVFARRGFMLYIYDHIEKAIIGHSHQDTIFVKENGRFKIKDNIEFIFYSSQMPCGDASIFPKSNEDDNGNIISSRKREAEGDSEMECKKLKSDTEDIHRTGAKCLPHNEQDPKVQGMNYHLLGQVRTKPGLGDRTLSVSCSDKMARWIHVGIQGALLDMLLAEPIYINHFIFGGGVPYCKESLIRALLKRNVGEDECIKISVTPRIYQTTAIFHIMKSEQRPRPAPGSIVLFKPCTIEVAVQGKKLGVTKKTESLKKNALCISKYYMYRRFLDILQKDKSLQEKLTDGKLESIPYNVMKRKSQRYYDNWFKVRDNFFKSWTIKPDMWSFCISTEDLSTDSRYFRRIYLFSDIW